MNDPTLSRLMGGLLTSAACGLIQFLANSADTVLYRRRCANFSYSLALAILVNRKLHGINWFRAAYYTPVVISMVVAGIAWKWLYAENGLLNQLLKQLSWSDGWNSG